MSLVIFRGIMFFINGKAKCTSLKERAMTTMVMNFSHVTCEVNTNDIDRLTGIPGYTRSGIRCGGGVSISFGLVTYRDHSGYTRGGSGAEGE
jgi:hypothetical protein